MLPFVPLAAPRPLPVDGPFASIAVDAQRRRVFAAGADALAVIDADSGKLLATIRIGALSLAVEPLGGHVFAGTRDGQVREIDPDRKAIVRSLNGAGPVDVLLYDSTSGRLYAGAAHAPLETIDTRSFTIAGTVALPGDALTQLAADPITRDLYASFADRPELAVIDPQRGAVRTAFPTPGLAGAQVVRFDSALGEIVVAGTDGDLEVYDRVGTPVGGVNVPAGLVACDLDGGDHVLACADPAGVTFVQLQRAAAPVVVGVIALAGPVRAVFDAATHDAVTVRSLADGSHAQFQVFSRTAP